MESANTRRKYYYVYVRFKERDHIRKTQLVIFGSIKNSSERYSSIQRRTASKQRHYRESAQLHIRRTQYSCNIDKHLEAAAVAHAQGPRPCAPGRDQRYVLDFARAHPGEHQLSPVSVERRPLAGFGLQCYSLRVPRMPRQAQLVRSLTANGSPCTRYRPASRLGSWASRCTHSSPERCIQQFLER